MRPSIRSIYRTVLATLACLLIPVSAQTVGEVLPAWTEGTLDIHHINTGRGNSTLLILPDGTTLLIDAGDGGRLPPRGTAPKPDASRGPGEWIARYARHMLAHDASPAIDYGYLTHFHDDHMGGPGASTRRSAGGYVLSGITEVGEHIPIRTMIDRGWPDYAYPAPLRDGSVTNYRAFLDWQQKKGMKAERLQPGRNDQIVLKRHPAKYPNFEIRNIAANGEVWTGVATNTRQQFPRIADLTPDAYPSENMCSLAVRLSYGKFDYFSGGDMPGVRRESAPVWNDVETPVAQSVGPVEAMILDHHGNRDSQNAFFLATLRPQVFVIPVWSSDHPGHDVIDRLYSTRVYVGSRDGFATNMLESNRLVIGELLDRLKSTQGHIVIRVSPGGGTFHVIILDDSAESFKVKNVFGPYESR